jgi:biotin carboxyl carrier protein
VRSGYRRADGSLHEVSLEPIAELAANVSCGSLSGEFRVEALGNGRFRMTMGSRSWRVCVDRDGATRHVTIEGVGEARFERESGGRRRRREAPKGSHSSPMPGTVVKVLVAPGQLVEGGQDLVVVEAMKMEIKVSAQVAGKVRAVHVAEGDRCDGGQILAEIEAS